MICFYIIMGCALGVAYLVITSLFLSTNTITNTEYHEGGFLNMGYTSNSHREATPKDVWVALAWPLFFGLEFIRCLMQLLNDLLCYLLLMFGIKYKKTRMYKLIDDL